MEEVLNEEMNHRQIIKRTSLGPHIGCLVLVRCLVAVSCLAFCWSCACVR
jgi:hypothetical protein